MRRVLVLVFVLLGMLWQATAVAGPMVLAPVGEGLEHAVLHWQEEGHHHHDDGSYHRDDSEASAEHLALDASLGAPALWSTPLLTFAVLEADGPELRDSLPPPTPILERLRRPPRPGL
jgi:hypothetical protein